MVVPRTLLPLWGSCSQQPPRDFMYSSTKILISGDRNHGFSIGVPMWGVVKIHRIRRGLGYVFQSFGVYFEIKNHERPTRSSFEHLLWEFLDFHYNLKHLPRIVRTPYGNKVSCLRMLCFITILYITQKECLSWCNSSCIMHKEHQCHGYFA